MLPKTLDQLLTEFGTDRTEEPALETVSSQGTHQTLTWGDIERRTRRYAEILTVDCGQGHSMFWLPTTNTASSVLMLLAALRAGRAVAPLDGNAPRGYRDRLLAAVASTYGPLVPLRSALLEGGSSSSTYGVQDLPGTGRVPDEGGYLLSTGGSTGTATTVLHPGQPTWVPGNPPLTLAQTGWREGQTQLVVGPLHHAAPFSHLLYGVLSGNRVILPERYSAQGFVDTVADFGAEWVQMTPLHMRMVDPLLRDQAHRLRSLRTVLHTAARCPTATKRLWIDVLGPDRIFEMYAATEGIGATLCRGDEWLARPGTVGRGLLTQIRVCDDAGGSLGPGQVGTVFMRSPTGRRLRASNRAAPAGPKGFTSVADHGYLDKDGYLFLAGRADDLVTVGGHNVYLEEVDAALQTHPDVKDAAVISVHDEVLENRLVACAVPEDGTEPTTEGIRQHCAAHLPGYQVPSKVILVQELPRNAAGKLLRSKLALLAQ